MTAEVSAAAVDRFNALPQDHARARLAACLPVARWVEDLVQGRPYAGWPAVQERATRAAAQLDDEELAAALAGHPRIGERAPGPASTRQARFSAVEQSGVDAGEAELARALATGNAAYEQRFGRVFLIRAAGRTGAEVLAELRRRLGNDDDTERAETVTQLREIALRRLREVLR